MSILKVYADKEYTLDAPEGLLLSEAFALLKIPFDMPCGGRGSCGKCRVRAFGNLSPVSDEERRHLGKDLSRGIRLACRTSVLGDAAMFIEKQGTAVIEGLGVLPVLAADLQKASSFGAAIDIGTTTIAAAAFRLDNCAPLAQVLEKNAQGFSGADVITRIDYCGTHGVAALSGVIRSQLNGILSKLAQTAGIASAVFDEVVVTGNTTMLHLLFGLDPASIAVYPFEPKSLFGITLPARDIGIEIRGSLHAPACISAYIGADLACAVLASGMTESGETSLLADIGTNGEMALFHNGRLTCCSTAAGPAFEGAGLSCGMGALGGAIDKVQTNGEQILFSTIGKEMAKGICGSGIVDALAVFKTLALIDETGRIEDGSSLPVGSSGVTVTQEDVRKIQLAKSAICAGMLTLVHEAGVELEEIKTLYLAGGFGNYLNVKSAAEIGLIPRELEQKVRYIGNAALTGAAAVLLDPAYREKSLTGVEISLSQSTFFMDKYIDCMMFE